ncbi:tRNA (adenosine(37)-N6)-threonylcarbamoyltransferase complex dimerization subunit type 1 TsaB [Granulicella sp. 5B5]|uniref:tRNA (adenosine(37)-N6)-threonylcarbamoyltransferase complex dimerization subunit type 1 TsaB n=1 Tax=Granulicella sp. 5B5 TaxID=1617967 RepID=UPI0015F41015|nr:tRNA (adenosine(37)-N6)-threonylcarbamoyltransferase complex dimerization subunit type 1 TsaB [Granulicella sp. 5B5]QMV19982.1 tRNA (adenosine(37)-N6)-threonylcarbamoyltransferase complex dimerization subunit type 1 TsaB [Granulicella sp. 5B5]
MERLLLIDTCGEGSGVAVSVGEQVVASETLPRNGGSAEIVGAVGRVLASVGCGLAELDAIGVVSGPGSFTGVRVGMAAAKGLAEAAEVRMIAVSRLEVLAEAARLSDGWVALDAGRGEFYAMDVRDGVVGRERLVGLDALRAEAGALEIAAAEERVVVGLREAAMKVRLHPLCVEDALRPLLKVLRSGAAEMSLGDANYVRRESDIYAAKSNGNVKTGD